MEVPPVANLPVVIETPDRCDRLRRAEPGHFTLQQHLNYV
jgi:hypothetical protein